MDSTSTLALLRPILKSQYRSSLAMLQDAVEKFPESHWLRTSDHPNAAWQIAYHTLFFLEYYAQRDEHNFAPWLTHGVETQVPDSIPGPPDPESKLPLIPDPFTIEQILSYCHHCNSMIDEWIDRMDLLSPNSGFHWYKISKLEHQLINIRHTQHGAAQLADRLRTIADLGVKWAGHRHSVAETA